MNNIFQNVGKLKTNSRKKENFLDTVEKKSVKKGGNSKTSINPIPEPDGGWDLYQKTENNMKTNVKSKKGGNFLETIGEFVAPTGWEGFATAAGLLALDSANSALKRGKKSSKKMKGGLPLPPPPSLFTNTFFKESRQPEKDYLESFIENYKKQGTIIDKYAEKRLLDYFNKLKTNQEKLEAKRKLHVFLNDPSINSNKSNKIKKILESIQL